ncbi:uncharacterized protein [Ptychodera flava]|uniref:uncharacterized protein n=1 Tax=Ptychodera flava TaxID=63121 RepID=UPI00396A6D43
MQRRQLLHKSGSTTGDNNKILTGTDNSRADNCRISPDTYNLSPDTYNLKADTYKYSWLTGPAAAALFIWKRLRTLIVLDAAGDNSSQFKRQLWALLAAAATVLLIDSKYLLEIIKKAEETERTKCTATSATTQPTNVSSKIMTDKSSPHQAEETQICGDQLQVPGTETPTKWPKGASTTLVQLRLNKDEEFHKHKVHKQLWNEINNEMKDRGYTFTADQCLNKWKSLKREYKSTVDHNSHTGNNKKTCLFYEEFNRLYGNKPSTRPDYTIESSLKAGEGDSVAPVVDHTDNATPSKPRGRSKCSNVGQLMTWLTSFQEEQKDNIARQEELQRKLHAEKMARFDRLLDIIDKK